jgi:hypothetical protein
MVSMLDDYESLPAVAPAAVDRKRVATALSAISDGPLRTDAARSRPADAARSVPDGV